MELTPKEKARDLCRAVNSFGLNAETMAESWHKDDIMLLIVLCWAHLASVMPDYLIDDRNAISVRRLRQVALVLSGNETLSKIKEKYSDFESFSKSREDDALGYAVQTAYHIVIEGHRTLQQSLASVACHFLSGFDWFPAGEMVELAGTGKWYRFPMV